MLITTTSSLEGRTVTEYRGVVFGEVITGINVMRDIGASLHNFFGGRVKGYEEELMRVRTECLTEMAQQHFRKWTRRR